LEQLARSRPYKLLEVDQVSHQWPNKESDEVDTVIVYGSPRGVVVSLRPACQEWSNTLEPIENRRINQFVRNGMFKDSPNPAHTRVDRATTPAEFNHLCSDGLECQWPEVFRREHAVKLIQGLDDGPNDVDFAGLFAIFEIMLFGMSQEDKAEFTDTGARIF
jgi:hypothetical protein